MTVTTEDDFQGALDANPEDWHTRLVFADWLQDRDDPRAEGYRALGALRLRPVLPPRDPFGEIGWWRHDPRANGGSGGYPDATFAELPKDWFGKVKPTSYEQAGSWWKRFGNGTRRDAEDAAALAFAKLPSKRRTVLLATATTATATPARKKPARKARKPSAKKSTRKRTK